MTTDGQKPLACHRCGTELDPARFDVDRWVVLDAREDGWTLVACSSCQTAEELERARVTRSICPLVD